MGLHFHSSKAVYAQKSFGFRIPSVYWEYGDFDKLHYVYYTTLLHK